MPSKHISVPRKQPDKLGFDEVRNDVKMEPAKMALFSFSALKASLCCWNYNDTDLLLLYVQVFMINLKRRADRKQRMLRALHHQEIACKVISAVDGM